MKAFAAVAGVIVGLGLVVVTALFIVPRLKAGSPAGTPQINDRSVGTGKRLEAPKDETERMKMEIERKRVPFFQMLHEKFGAEIERASVVGNVDTLDLIVKKSDADSIQWLVQNAIGPQARDYGFERVRFYIHNPVSRTEPYAVVAESSWDGSTRWNTFLK